MSGGDTAGTGFRPCPERTSPGGLRVTLLGEGEARTYDGAGVSLATADAVVERLRAAVESTGATGFGAFAALHPLGVLARPYAQECKTYQVRGSYSGASL